MADLPLNPAATLRENDEVRAPGFLPLSKEAIPSTDGAGRRCAFEVTPRGRFRYRLQFKH